MSIQVSNDCNCAVFNINESFNLLVFLDKVLESISQHCSLLQVVVIETISGAKDIWM